MKIGAAGSYQRASLLGKVVGAIASASFGLFIASSIGQHGLGVFQAQTFKPVEGTAVGLSLSEPVGKSRSRVLVFSLDGKSGRYCSTAVDAIHPSWLAAPASIRTYLREGEESPTGSYGCVKTYGLWVNGVEQASLQRDVDRKGVGVAVAIFMSLLFFAAAVVAAYSAYVDLTKNEG